MFRLLFTKKGNAVWISHLDLMRVFQRAFKRAGLPLTHTQGYNPRPSVSIALPLSVGIESNCELLDFALDGDPIPCEEIRQRLNAALSEGINVLEVYEQGRKIRDLALLQSLITLEYDNGIPNKADSAIRELFGREEVIVPKKTKNGMQDQNIVSMIRCISVTCMNDREICIDVLACCQNPTLNPMQIPAAIELYLPELNPNFSRCSRMEIYDQNETVFR